MKAINTGLVDINLPDLTLDMETDVYRQVRAEALEEITAIMHPILVGLKWGWVVVEEDPWSPWAYRMFAPLAVETG